MAHTIKELLDGNKRWVEETRKSDPGFFTKLALGQTPTFLWIGCSDSRVPATDITATFPGSIFVQRNIANMVIHTDSNMLSVVYYAVTVLRVKHIIVCGHYGCGGVKAAIGNERLGYIDNWLRHIKDVYRLHRQELDAIKDEDLRTDRLVELNVKEQVNNLSTISFIQEQWQSGEFPYIHGWVYKLNDGLIRDLKVTRNNANSVEEVYRYNPT